MENNVNRTSSKYSDPVDAQRNAGSVNCTSSKHLEPVYTKRCEKNKTGDEIYAVDNTDRTFPSVLLQTPKCSRIPSTGTTKNYTGDRSKFVGKDGEKHHLLSAESNLKCTPNTSAKKRKSVLSDNIRNLGYNRTSAETTPIAYSSRFSNLLATTPVRSLVNEGLHMDCSETPEWYSNVNFETPKQTSRSQEFFNLPDEETSNLTVCVRVRPLNQKERTDSLVTNIVTVIGNELKVTCDTGIEHRFSYDHCFWSCDSHHTKYASQEVIFSVMVQPLLEKALKGYNACLFAYGQTGSGKSYSMMGLETEGDVEIGKEAGVIPRFCHALFEHIDSIKCVKNKENFGAMNVQISYFEIYNEKIHDLLGSSTEGAKRAALKVREHPVFGPYVVDLSQHNVNSYEDVKSWLLFGNSQRATAATVMNEKSSRSHSIFSIILTHTEKETLSDEVYEHSRRSHINLVDLAGSERISQTCATGDRLREGVSINKSLMTLGKVIASLAESTSSKRRNFVPYRESLLTWLLRESLGGNSQTTMLATISPASIHKEETLATLRYACQARSVINRVRINEDPTHRLIRQLREEVKRLREEHDAKMSLNLHLLDAKRNNSDAFNEIAGREEELNSLRERLHLCEEELAKSRQRLRIELDEAKNTLMTQNEIGSEEERRSGSKQSAHQKQIEKLGKCVEEEISLIAEEEKNGLLLKIKALEAELNEKVNRRNLHDVSLDVSLTPFKSNLLEELQKVLNEPVEDSSELEASERSSLETPECSDELVTSLNSVDSNEQNTGTTEHCNEVGASLEENMNKMEQNSLEQNESASDFDEFHVVSQNVNETICQSIDESASSSKDFCSSKILQNKDENLFEHAVNNFQRIDDAVFTLDDILKSSADNRVKEALKVINSAVLDLWLLFKNGFPENSIQDQSDSCLDSTIHCLNSTREEFKQDEQNATIQAGGSNSHRKCVRFVFSDSQNNID